MLNIHVDTQMPQALLLFYKLLRIELLFTTFIPMILLLQAAKY